MTNTHFISNVYEPQIEIRGLGGISRAKAARYAAASVAVILAGEGICAALCMFAQAVL